MIKFSYYVALIISMVTIQVSRTAAQQFGVKGKVLDIETYKPIPGVSIKIANTTLATSTDEAGEFSINLPSKTGEYTLVSTFVGYDPDSTKFNLQANDWEFVPVTLINTNSTLDEVVVTRRRERASEIALLEERKLSNLMVEKIGAQELSRKGVSDAEGALTKMSGVTKSASGANVFVRGLGDRYNSTTLNGLALPSEDPLNKNISLDFFGTGIIQSIGVNKTFNASLGGDVAGANIDILSKEYEGKPFLEIGASAGGNSQVLDANNFNRINGTNWFGALKESKSNISSLTQYDFRNGWNPSVENTPLNSSFSLSGGKLFQLGSDKTLSLFITGNMRSDYEYYDGIARQTNTTGAIFRDQSMTRSVYQVSKTALANLKYSFGNNQLAFNSLFINDQNQDFGEYYGLNEVSENGDIRLFRRQTVTDNSLFVNQLLSKINLSEAMDLDLGLGYNLVKGNEPDRRTTNLYERDGVVRVLDNTNGADNERYYSNITEHGFTGKAIATYKILNDNGFDRKIDFGYNGNIVKRNFDAFLHWHDIVNTVDPVVSDINDIDGIFNQDRLNDNFFEMKVPLGLNEPYWYKVSKQIHSAIGVGTYQFNDQFTAVLGLRYDKVLQEVTWRTNIGSSNLEGPSKIDKNYILPSLNLKYVLTQKSNLRASGSKSYTLPQFVEYAPFRNEYALFKAQGNSSLVPVETWNVDFKWELFPGMGELIAAGVFYKNLKNPILRSETPVAGNTVSYYNAGSTAQVAGAEVEFKKNLLKKRTDFGDNVLSAGANLSYLYSKQDLKSSSSMVAQFTNEEAELQGASPFLANADISYLWNLSGFRLNSSIILNYFSDRIYSVGTGGFNNMIEKGVATLDFVSTAEIRNRWKINVRVRNISNPSYELHRETSSSENIVLESYKRGIDGSIGLTYTF